MQRHCGDMEHAMFKEGEEGRVAGTHNCSPLTTLAHGACLWLCKRFCSGERVGKHLDGNGEYKRMVMIIALNAKWSQ